MDFERALLRLKDLEGVVNDSIENAPDLADAHEAIADIRDALTEKKPVVETPREGAEK